MVLSSELDEFLDVRIALWLPLGLCCEALYFCLALLLFMHRLQSLLLGQSSWVRLLFLLELVLHLVHLFDWRSLARRVLHLPQIGWLHLLSNLVRFLILFYFHHAIVDMDFLAFLS